MISISAILLRRTVVHIDLQTGWKCLLVKVEIKCSSLKKKKITDNVINISKKKIIKVVIQNDKLYRQNKHTNEERKRENK